MEKIFNWIKIHKYRAILIVAALFFVPLIVVHLLFKWHSNIFMIKAEWSAGDLITYIAGFEAFIGTVALGTLALWQNNTFKLENDKKDKLFLQTENEKIRLSYLPQFLVQKADPEECVDNKYKLSAQYAETHVSLNRFKTYGIIINKDGISWIPSDKYPIIERGTENRIFSIVNCGNNTAHQVKLSIRIGDNKFLSEKSSSVQKDDDIFIYFGLNQEVVIKEKIFLIIRFFDCFQNVYEQNFEILNEADCLYLISYGDVELVKRNKSMDLQPVNDKK